MEKIQKILFWCAVLGLGMNFLMTSLIVLGEDFLYSVHVKMFSIDVPQGTFNFAMDCFHGFVKLSIIILFIIPWIAMKIVDIRDHQKVH
jgi:hypothetical protein